MITKEQFAERLQGREYGSEMTKEEEALAKDNNLLVVFGYSDDNMEFRGIFCEEAPCYDGDSVWFDADGKTFCRDDGEHVFMDQENGIDKCPNNIESVWCPRDESGEIIASWIYKTDIPHATFTIMEDGDLYCVGIVIDGRDLKKVVVSVVSNS